MDKKQKQLGMNPSTASHRLVKDLLWFFIYQNDQNTCYKCGEEMTRETFSIEHMEPWLDSEDPLGMYFDLTNIGFSHLSCNSGGRREGRQLKPCGTIAAYDRGCRCEPCKKEKSAYKGSKYTTEYRQAQYKRTGK
jgi:hypothetical protein